MCKDNIMGKKKCVVRYIRQEEGCNQIQQARRKQNMVIKFYGSIVTKSCNAKIIGQ